MNFMKLNMAIVSLLTGISLEAMMVKKIKPIIFLQKQNVLKKSYFSNAFLHNNEKNFQPTIQEIEKLHKLSQDNRQEFAKAAGDSRLWTEEYDGKSLVIQRYFETKGCYSWRYPAEFDKMIFDACIKKNLYIDKLRDKYCHNAIDAYDLLGKARILQLFDSVDSTSNFDTKYPLEKFLESLKYYLDTYVTKSYSFKSIKEDTIKLCKFYNTLAEKIKEPKIKIEIHTIAVW